MRSNLTLAAASAILALGLSVANAADKIAPDGTGVEQNTEGQAGGSKPVSKAVQDACVADYHKYCDDYGLETAALRMCMDKAGQSLSKPCVRALIQAGEVSQAEVDSRKKSGR